MGGRAAAYRVLARKYRPARFEDLIGQEALVRTLTNAIRSGRLAHAFMLTGVRGVGKTTTARIIARALNCIGPDGQGGPTISPCRVCEHCRAIAQDRHVDVVEMDAASNNGVEDIREIIDAVRFAPASARYKIYIIDEVHMLSKAAFNALLKTLEEPPPHVKFLFATTEIRKVPITVLSRCQRFDLRRVDSALLVEHFHRIAAQEGVTLEPDAAALIARAADGSVRDGLSLLDQAIVLGGDRVSAEQVRDMLGLADRGRVFDLFEAAMSARPREALDVLADLHRRGADPVVVLQDLLDLTHELTRFKVVPEAAADPGTPEMERARGGALAARLSMPALTRAWQILLKGLGEVQVAPVPADAAEMVVIRLAYAAELPSPADLVRRLQDGAGAGAGAPGASAPEPRGGGAVPADQPAPVGSAPAMPLARPEPVPVAGAGPLAHAESRLRQPVADTTTLADPQSFRELVELFAERGEPLLYSELRSAVHLVRFEPGRLEFRPAPGAQKTLANRVGELLGAWTGRRWIVSVVGEPGAPTLLEQERDAERRAKEEAARHPVVRAVLEAFPNAEIVRVRGPQPAVAGNGLADDPDDDDFMLDAASPEAGDEDGDV